METKDIVVVGGGLSAAATVESYRKAGGDGSVLIVSQEPHHPIHRPPLSKGYLRGQESRESLFVHPESYYSEHGIDLRLGEHVERVVRPSHELLLGDGDRIFYQTLVLATGARPRRLPVPGADLPGVIYLRSMHSSDVLRQEAQRARRAVIIGAGFVGMEVAASLVDAGIECTVVEMADRMWPALMPAGVTAQIEYYCAQRGMHFRFGRRVTKLEGSDRVQRVALDDGEILEADLVVAGVGAILNTELAENAGLPVDRGVIVDSYLRTEDPSVYAVGDIASIPDAIGGRQHMEHWENAMQQGRALGKTLAGDPTPYERVASFFSDIFDLGINMIGYPAGWDEIVSAGSEGSVSGTTLYGRNGVLAAVLMINDDALYGQWGELIAAGTPFASALDEARATMSAL